MVIGNRKVSFDIEQVEDACLDLQFADAMKSCKSVDEVDAASEKAFADAKQWSREVIMAVQENIFGVGRRNNA